MIDVFREAKRLLLKNYKATGGKFIPPSLPYYPHEWLWDTCFHAISCTALGLTDIAKEILERLLLCEQRQDGFIPHIIFHGHSWFRFRFLDIEKLFFKSPHRSAYTQPPVFAQALDWIEDPVFGGHVFEKVFRFFLYFIEKQDPDHDGLISNFHPRETGRDSTPEFDRWWLARPYKNHRLSYLLDLFLFLKINFRYRKQGWQVEAISKKPVVDVEDLMFNAIWVDGMEILSKFAPDENTKERVKELARKTEEAILTKCWDEKTKMFYSLGPKNDHIKTITISNLFPIILPHIQKDKAESIVNLLTDKNRFWTPYPPPSVAASEPSFDPDFKTKLLWRGPVWINMNWYLVYGLLRHGFYEVARDLATRTFSMVEKEGFREFYHPFTGKGMRVKNFGWSTLIVTFPKLFARFGQKF
jgi:glycogen debranching enzyme